MDDVLINKSAAINRCLSRIEKYFPLELNKLKNDYDIQDILILNLLRACENCIDMGMHVIFLKHFGIPQSKKEVFSILSEHNIISAELAKNMEKIAGFRNIAVHEYQKLNVEILYGILNNHLQDLKEYCNEMLSYNL